MKTKIAINGFGRIGRVFFRVASERNELDIVAINDLADPENLAYLLKYDSVYGRLPFDISLKKETDRAILSVGKKAILLLRQEDPAHLPWKALDVDIVVEATGAFASFAKSQTHLHAGARRVVITAPVKDEPVGDLAGTTVLMGINEEKLETCDISSNASCTTNAVSPIIAILNKQLGIEKAMLNTIHGYTSSQSLVDGNHAKDFRRGRAAAVNIVPTATGATTAVTKALPSLNGLFSGIAVRVPTLTGSLVDITFISKKKTTEKEVNDILQEAAKEERWKKVFSVTKDPVVSTDIIGSHFASIADLSFTKVIDKNFVRVLSWYDNEMGYAHSLVEHVISSGKYIRL